ncbi:MAG: Fe-S cluster assembly transcriptional regulator IscR [Candidatus Parabeggiatoa sp. nov. 3]|nr:MAG: Fe-S cluster assembly transcriptional regulator IscR [Gammaproteobacteria bacterium]RKZ57651.1 MAG: Fe-S cluster assembly transcriptional regulator IscR [Gammaproteobacteria bacterium]RKZ75900.1 MAG: Fe-S cluster assembly transcriptional regulator IscR [Gammaproteobacteria bacterium]HEW97268.1 Fe-S cluster assembly transcriptional regulator IscR [Beggiatoa sp.]
MRLTTKGRYAVTAMLDLAINQDQGPITLSDISQRQGISLSYLEQLFSRLRKKDLVDSTRGPGGGYRLSRPAKSIAIADVIAAVDEAVDATRCQGQKNCQDSRACLTHQLWTDLSEQIREFLDGITLAQVLDKRPQEVSKEVARQNKARSKEGRKTHSR